MIEGYARAATKLDAEMQSFSRFVAAQRAAGKPESPSWLFREERYQALMNQIDDEISKYSNTITNNLRADARKAAELGAVAQSRLSQASFKAFPPGFDPAVWSKLDVRSLQAITGFLQPGSPLTTIIDRMAPNAQIAVREALTAGMALGWGPDKMAAAMSKGVADMSLQRAQLISRTETMRAYRAAQQAGNKANPTIAGWTWVAKLDTRTCAICWSMHGEVFAVEETLPGHPNCRCAMVPKTKSWDELGLSGVPETTVDVPTGASQFKLLDPTAQRRILGPTRFEQYQNGKPLTDFVSIADNPLWGPTAVLSPLTRSASTPTLTARPSTAPIAPSDPRAVLENLFATGDITNVQPLGGGISGTFTAEIGGVKVVLKPESGNTRQVRSSIPQGTEPQREVLAYDVERAFAREYPNWKFDMPVLVMRDLPKGTLKLQTTNNVYGKTAIMEFKGDAKIAFDNPRGAQAAAQEEKNTFTIFDSVIGNTDRHAGNYMVHKDGHLIPIDHGLAFAEAADYGNTAFMNVRLKLTADEIAALRKIRADPELQAKIAALSPKAEAAFYVRLDRIIASGETLSGADLADSRMYKGLLPEKRVTPVVINGRAAPNAAQADTNLRDKLVDLGAGGRPRFDVTLAAPKAKVIVAGGDIVMFAGDDAYFGDVLWRRLDPAWQAQLKIRGYGPPVLGEPFWIKKAGPYNVVVGRPKVARVPSAPKRPVVVPPPPVPRQPVPRPAPGAPVSPVAQQRARARAGWNRFQAQGEPPDVVQFRNGDKILFADDVANFGNIAWADARAGMQVKLGNAGYKRPKLGEPFKVVRMEGVRIVVGYK